MDIWDWIRGLRRWWWMLVVFPLLAAGFSWLATPAPKYETSWNIHVLFDDPNQSNNPTTFDFIFLDDMDSLLKSSVLGDVMYMRLPEEAWQTLSRDEFGAMFSSKRKATFVEITVAGDDPELVRLVSQTLEGNLEEVANWYLVPPTYRGGHATVQTLDPIGEPALNTKDRLVAVGAITVATVLVSFAATGVAEWLRISYSAKKSAR